MVRFGQLGKLKPEKIKEYVLLHSEPWPDVLRVITECNLKNYSIYLHDCVVFAYFEYVGKDYDADMKKMEDSPVIQEWWSHTKPCFEKYAIDPDSEFYHDMQSIFYHP